MKKSFFLLVCMLTYFLTPLQIHSQEKNSFSLQKAIDYALEHNLNGKNADLNIEEAKWKKWETTATGLPQLNASLGYTGNLLLPDFFEAQEGSSTSEDTESSGSLNFLSFLYPKHQIKPSITLTQLIFDGTYIVGLQASKVFLEISKNAKIKTNNEITKAVTQAYGNVLLTKESINITEKNIQNLDLSLSESKALLENGLIEEENLEQLEITLINLENSKSRLEQMYVVAESMLKYLIGLPEANKIILVEDLHNLSTLSIEAQNKNFSVFNNIDYKIAESTVESNRLLYKAEQAKMLPSIAGYANLSTQVFGDSFGSMLDSEEFTFGSVGISLEFPVFTSFKSKAKRKQAKLNWDKAANQLTDTERKTALEIKSANIEFELAQKTLENQKRSLILSERIEKKNRIKHKEGLASSFELRDAQQQLYMSQQQYLQAMVDVINKKAQLESLTK